jgi:hypothetical protein
MSAVGLTVLGVPTSAGGHHAGQLGHIRPRLHARRRCPALGHASAHMTIVTAKVAGVERVDRFLEAVDTPWYVTVCRIQPHDPRREGAGEASPQVKRGAPPGT